MNPIPSAGARFRQSLELENPLQIVGTINAYCSLMAEHAGFRAIYLSGAGVANASFGVPDLGITTINDVVADIRRIVGVTQLPLLVDADTGFGNAFCMARTIREFSRAGAAGVHIEDQVAAKRCGHRPGKELVETAEMVDRIHAAVEARTDDSFFIMARTDALATEGMDESLERCHRYVAAGADGIFAEAVREAEQYRKFTDALSVPVLANMTEFGQSPLLTADQLGELGIAMVLYPLSAFRAMNAAAEQVYTAIRKERTQETVVDLMQTRDRLYEVLDYHRYEKQIDDLIRKSQK
ncbi:MAG: methylisocitrate lyase [Pirellulaceae bacterium]|nr:methylisocitrate lyase [Pirellulaceae bacterium]